MFLSTFPFLPGSGQSKQHRPTFSKCQNWLLPEIWLRNVSLTGWQQTVVFTKRRGLCRCVAKTATCCEVVRQRCNCSVQHCLQKSLSASWCKQRSPIWERSCCVEEEGKELLSVRLKLFSSVQAGRMFISNWAIVELLQGQNGVWKSERCLIVRRPTGGEFRENKDEKNCLEGSSLRVGAVMLLDEGFRLEKRVDFTSVLCKNDAVPPPDVK